jgi:hypothetical protein
MRRSRVRGILDDANMIRCRAFRAATQLFRRTRSFRRITVVPLLEDLHCADGLGNVDASPVRSSQRHLRASSTRLKGVSVARRKWLNPASMKTCRSRFSPACAPSPSPTSCDSELGVQTHVEAA